MAAYYNEFDPFAAAWLRELIKDGHIADGEVDGRSIVEVTGDDLRGFEQCHFFAGIGGWSAALRLARWEDARHVWTGSCPCQPFSLAGKRQGAEDARHLWPEFYRLISERRPAIVFGEQVAGKDGIAWADGVAKDFEAEDYAFGALVLPGHIVSAPQERNRIYFAANAAVADAGRWPADVWRDGRLSPMEARTWPVAPWQQGTTDAWWVDDGLSPQLVKSCLRGLGNAIIPQVAAEFIGAFLETLTV